MHGEGDLTLQRFSEYTACRVALGRRAVIEQAKGILMARHAIEADQAFDLLRDRFQRIGRKLAVPETPSSVETEVEFLRSTVRRGRLGPVAPVG